MSFDSPYMSKTYTHVWSLTTAGDSFLAMEPSWGWVAIGPRGHLAGAEHTSEKARHSATCAAFLLEAPKRQ